MEVASQGTDFRSFICDETGTIIANCVYKCIVCKSVFDSREKIRDHYYQVHVQSDDDRCLETPEKPKETTQDLPKQSTEQSSHKRKISDWDSDVSSDEFPMKLEESSTLTTTRDNTDPYIIDEISGQVEATVGKSGRIRCAVCRVVRFYSCVYRRYGHFTCQVCYRFFRTFFKKPQKYICNNLGNCDLDVRTRCKACWILACIKLYSVDPTRQEIIRQYYPENRCNLLYDIPLSFLMPFVHSNTNQRTQDEPLDMTLENRSRSCSSPQSLLL